MEIFNIKEAGRELEKKLRELGSGSIVRLTTDVQIPEYLQGDKQGFHNSILQICTYLRYIADLNIDVDIELLRPEQHPSEVRLNVHIRGSHQEKQVIQAFVYFGQDPIDSLLKALPYPTKFSHGDRWLHFSFLITFQHAAQTEDAAVMFPNKKILLAEENELSALTFVTFMEEWGCRVTKVSDGLSAIEAVKSMQYDMALINIHSAEMQGIEAIRVIRNFDRHIPIIGLTSPWSKDPELNAYAAGVNDILAKPVSTCELQKILRNYF
jgi:CheY-like chemotaxis protein